MEGVRQAVSHHGVLQGGIAHLHTCSHVQGVRSLWVEPGDKHVLSKIITRHLFFDCWKTMIPIQEHFRVCILNLLLVLRDLLYKSLVSNSSVMRSEFQPNNHCLSVNWHATVIRIKFVLVICFSLIYFCIQRQICS